MKPSYEDQRNRYFAELTIALKREGLESIPPEDSLLTVLLDGLPLCQISDSGSVRFQDADIGCAERKDDVNQVTQEVETVSEYCFQMCYRFEVYLVRRNMTFYGSHIKYRMINTGGQRSWASFFKRKHDFQAKHTAIGTKNCLPAMTLGNGHDTERSVAMVFEGRLGKSVFHSDFS